MPGIKVDSYANGRRSTWRWRQLLRLLPIVLAAGLPAAQAGGGEEPTIRRITPTEADSDCIGDPRTPLCAVETRMACFIRKDVSLCRQVGDHESVYGDDTHYACFDVESRYCEYTIDSAFYVVYEVFELNGIDLEASVRTIDWRRCC